MTLTVGSLFSGIGGLDLGLERAGMTVKWQSEVDSFCSQVLAKHWPHVPNLGDVTKIEWEGVERVDLICGGYPCQPFSVAGARRGTADARHLWPHFRDALSVLRPRYALLENVPGHLSLGFGDVLADLADCGYDAEWDCISAAAVGAPHLRSRLFVVAYATVQRREPLRTSEESGRSGAPRRLEPTGLRGTLADSDDGGFKGVSECDRSTQQPRIFAPFWNDVDGRGRSIWWDVEPAMDRVAHGIPRVVDRLRALGNAVVPQVAEYIGRRILGAAA